MAQSYCCSKCRGLTANRVPLPGGLELECGTGQQLCVPATKEPGSSNSEGALHGKRFGGGLECGKEQGVDRNLSGGESL